MGEQIKAPEKIQLRQPIRCTVQNTKYILLIMLLGIRKFTELVEYGRKLEKEMKAMLSEIKENVQGTKSDRKETETQINDLDQKEEINIQPEQNEETGIQKK